VGEESVKNRVVFHPQKKGQPSVRAVLLFAAASIHMQVNLDKCMVLNNTYTGHAAVEEKSTKPRWRLEYGTTTQQRNQ
jgi:hypothetical protein